MCFQFYSPDSASDEDGLGLTLFCPICGLVCRRLESLLKFPIDAVANGNE